MLDTIIVILFFALIATIFDRAKIKYKQEKAFWQDYNKRMKRHQHD
jgi:hypothetical protein